MRLPTTAVVLAFAAVAMVLSGGVAAQDTCTAADDRPVGIQDVSAPDTLVVDGEDGTVSITVENAGNQSKDVVVFLYVLDPDNETRQFQLARQTLSSGESTTIDQSLNATTPGRHGLQVELVDPSTGQRYDLSEPMTVDVRSDPPARLGGPLDRSEFALGALVLAILGLIGLGYRTFD